MTLDWSDDNHGILATANDDSRTAIKESVRDAWHKFVTAILPGHDGVEWNSVRAEIWADTGRLIVFPAKARDRYRIDTTSMTITWPSLIAKCREVDDESSDDREEEVLAEFEAMALSILDEWELACRSAPLDRTIWIELSHYDEPLRDFELE